MAIRDSQYPATVFDGIGPTRTLRSENRVPGTEDWDQLIAEVIAVQRQQLDDRELSAVNDQGGPVLAGHIVYMKNDGTIALADSDTAVAAALKIPVGMLKSGVADGISVKLVFMGRLTLTTAEWDAVGTDANGLDPGAKYFLSGTPGNITTVVPNTAGDTLFVIGVAISATTMLVRLDDQGLDIA